MEKNSPIFNQKSPWIQGSHSIWLASTMSLYRNLEKFKFPNKLDDIRKQQVISLVKNGLEKCPELKNPQLFRAEETSPLEKEFLLEQYLSTESFHQAHGGEGFVIDDSGEFLAVINLQNHLELELIDTQQELEKTWNRLVKIETFLGNSLDYAYNSRFGFLTVNPLQSGTALLVNLYLHIPAIIHTGELAETLEKETEEEVIATGMQGSANEMIGDILLAQNRCTIGLTEEYIIASLRMWATKVVVAEISIRSRLKKDNDTAMKNKIARALGLLTHAYQLEPIEALNALSLVKLGVDLGWIANESDVNLNQVFFNCRRAHLINLLGGNVEVPEIPRKRAEYLHTISSKLILSI